MTLSFRMIRKSRTIREGRTIRKSRTIREDPAARAAGRETRESCSACPCRAHPPSRSTSSSARRFPDCAPNQVRDPAAAKFFAITCDFATLTAVMEDERRIFR